MNEHVYAVARERLLRRKLRIVRLVNKSVLVENPPHLYGVELLLREAMEDYEPEFED
jgi:hypothetical protein